MIHFKYIQKIGLSWYYPIFLCNASDIIYILECDDGTYYTGITNQLTKRLRQHQIGKASKYTRSRLPVKLVYTEYVPNKSIALQREYQLKKLPRSKKEQMISSYNGELKDESTKEFCQ